MQYVRKIHIFGNLTNRFEDIDLKRVKGVLLDLDDTLYSYEKCNKLAYDRCREVAFFQYEIKSLIFDNALRDSRKKTNESLFGQSSSHSRLLYFHDMFESLFGKSNPSFALHLEEIYWNVFLENLKFTQESHQFLIQLKRLSIPSCIVTDLTAQIQMRKWEKLGLSQYVNFLVTSEEAGVEKPDPKIFKLALSKLNLNASEVIMIGDNEEKDIAGAKQLGIKSYCIKAENQ